MPKERITKLLAGDLAPFPTEVRPKCEGKAGRWYCATHQERFDNQLQKDSHIHAGAHALGWVCSEHGLEEP